MFRRTLGSPALFAVAYSAIAGSIYFALGAVADHALGLTPLVFLAAGLFFAVTVMTYVEAASLHQERGGATVFARYAFNELVSFVAGWAILLDYLILLALTAFTATNYLATFWAPLGRGAPEVVLSLALLAGVALVNVRGVSVRMVNRLVAFALADLALQVVVILLGLFLVFDGTTLVDQVDLGTTPAWGEVVFAFTLSIAAFAGLEASSGLAGEVPIGRMGLRRLVSTRIAATLATYVGIALVAITALPVRDGATALGDRFLEAPVVAVVGTYDTGADDVLRWTVAGLAAIVLGIAANTAMLGLSRLAYGLATNRQIPSAVGLLHPRYSTPIVVIPVAAVLAGLLVIPADLDFLLGIYAFGALLTFTIAHLSVLALRYREPDRDRPYRIPGSVSLRGVSVPLPAVVGALAAGAAWVSVLVQHSDARLVGAVWMALGLTLYLVYRTTEDKPILKRVRIPEQALRAEPRTDTEYGSILVPVFGRALDDDIMQTAGRLAGEENEDEGEGGAVIEALWVFEVPMSLPVDARIPESELKRARQALARAKAVGEEYEGVEVATATVRARRAGQAIVEEARRRGVEAIVLAAEEPSRIRGGALLGGRGGPLDNFVGDVTKYVVDKSPCRVILTAPPADGVRHRRPGPATLPPESAGGAAPGAGSAGPGPDADSPR